MQNAFGETLKDWRNQRRMSQLDLGLTASVSARHISFLETGRSKPSRTMVLHLCETLELPRNARNTILTAAGFAPVYRQRNLDEDEMVHVREAVDWTLERHDPFPAFALDRHWAIVKANRAAMAILASTGLSEGDSLLQFLTDKAKMVALLENWEEVMQHMIVRLRTESAHLGGDPVLEEAIENLSRKLRPSLRRSTDVLPAVVPARYRAGDVTLSFFSTIAQFGTAEDIALAELKIELMFPADEATRALLLAAET